MPQSAIDQQLAEITPTQRIGPDEVARMVNDLFNEMLGIPLNPEPQETADIVSPDLQASISTNGNWEAEFHVLVSDELATRIANGMYGSEADELTEAEIQDAIGEIVNIIGGNAKGMVDLDCNLSLPCVGRCIRKQPQSALSLTFDCAGLPITIVIIE